MKSGLYRGGGWYIANFRERAFVRSASIDPRRYPMDPDRIYVIYAWGRTYAKCYVNQDVARKRAQAINAQIGGKVPTCSVVTAEAARCLDMIWMRERCAERGGMAGKECV